MIDDVTIGGAAKARRTRAAKKGTTRLRRRTRAAAMRLPGWRGSRKSRRSCSSRRYTRRGGARFLCQIHGGGEMKHAGSDIVVPVHDAFAGIAVADTSVSGLPLRIVREGHAHQVVTERKVEYCYTSHVLGTRMGMARRNHSWWACAA